VFVMFVMFVLCCVTHLFIFVFVYRVSFLIDCCCVFDATVSSLLIFTGGPCTQKS
jgi:hypothetical protein